MSAFNIEVDCGKSVKLSTAGKYCDRDIVVNATGGDTEGAYNEGYEEGYTKGYDNAIDAVCPTFKERGNAVMCFPMDEMKVEAFLDEGVTATVTRCGKNILDVHNSGVYHNNAASQVKVVTVTETGLRVEALKEITSDGNRWGFYLGTVKELAGKTITVSCDCIPYKSGGTLQIDIFGTDITPAPVGKDPSYNNGGYIGSTGTTKLLRYSQSGPCTYTITGEEEWEYIGIAFRYVSNEVAIGDWVEFNDVQVEYAPVATSYEPYNGENFAITDGETIHIPALDGVNCLTIDNDGIIEVSGYANAKELLDYVTNEIISLGADV